MLQICLVICKSEPQYAYKRYDYKKNMYNSITKGKLDNANCLRLKKWDFQFKGQFLKIFGSQGELYVQVVEFPVPHFISDYCYVHRWQPKRWFSDRQSVCRILCSLQIMDGGKESQNLATKTWRSSSSRLPRCTGLC